MLVPKKVSNDPILFIPTVFHQAAACQNNRRASLFITPISKLSFWMAGFNKDKKNLLKQMGICTQHSSGKTEQTLKQ